jgi:hypothetical protein
MKTVCAHKRKLQNFIVLLKNILVCHPMDRTAWSSGLHSCFVLGMFRVQISAREPATVTEDLRGFPQSHQANDGIVL